ncbi:4-hydroxy-tetrahydrodipicolinate synthase [Psychroserpens sp.]|uniref:4-hydroxy-tetrahydrodipicolinate synthase n=1 Tax=Psychroserpens sp. TaxID=2020870 RepID=UPI001B175771|nr:4-hydroxy-tetrahydrodipicolinate synthase [Psychroserpens sp.]MBO6606802.1 4-hydroxy-tetrahydrodipicolinate synthase [Psychroserpens sp.]MBO6632143.1 4-hydroxy-tetrahydrodipicolinate synthase [Psychroserpens sp.]MBO6653505.1 4-hydroxy-tetrahydrodipicolinate synthase [Psychroserpens sp.]MBO6680467.1 4-hydroxy-tetrahydrodipicolinate synthase [Psychroserpens sp.]MBO6750574.1 4-hydroxy-tetrahydrodipicolinate synthase [Psychroserpens sp.]
MTKFYGTGVAIITPFNEDGSVDHEALSNLVDYNIENGTNYIVISGTTGESVTITKQEKKDIIQTIIRATNARVPLVLGIGGNNTATIIDEINATDLSQIDALLSVSPYYSKPTQEGIYQHFKAIAEASPIDIILYNVPGRTSSNMLPETTLRLARDFDNIIAVKEAGNNVHQYLNLLRDKPEDFLVISGDDDLVLGVVLAGGAGVISVLGQALPKQFTKMIKLGLEGKAKEAYKIHFDLMDMTSLIFSENNPAGIKAVLEALNLSRSDVRLPLVEATDDLKNKIRLALDKLNN